LLCFFSPFAPRFPRRFWSCRRPRGLRGPSPLLISQGPWNNFFTSCLGSLIFPNPQLASHAPPSRKRVAGPERALPPVGSSLFFRSFAFFFSPVLFFLFRDASGCFYGKCDDNRAVVPPLALSPYDLLDC